MNSKPNPVLVRQSRGNRFETLHRGALILVRQREILVHCGDVDSGSFMRSGAKFFQALPGVIAGSAERFQLDNRALALACASHNAEPEHVEVAEAMLAAGGLVEDDLVCGPHRPMHPKTSALMLARSEAPRKIHNNCSGKHAAMMLAAQARAEDHEDYANPQHPLQQEIKRILAEYSGALPSEIEAAVDGCGAPTWIMPLRGAAQAFARFGKADSDLPQEMSKAAGRLCEAIRAEPQMIAGSGRLCTALARVSDGRILAKVGADGFYGAMERERGLGLAFHLDDGSSLMAERLLVAALTQLGLLSARELEDLGPFADYRRLNCAGELVGQIEVELPPMTL